MDNSAPPNGEVAALKDELQRQREQIAELQEQMQSTQPARQPATPTVGRRGLMAGGGLGLLGLLAASGNAAAATDPNDSDGDLGTNANPWDTYLNGLALATQQVSSAATITKPVVLYDSSISSFTLTIDASLEGPSGYSQPVVFIDRTGNADANPVTVEDSTGATIATIPAANSIFETWWDSGEWVTDRFIPTVDAGTLVGRPDLVLDGNSPDNSGGSVSSYTYTLADSYDYVELYFELSDPTGNLLSIDMRVNGDTGSNYFYRLSDGTSTSSVTEFQNIGFVRSNATDTRFHLELQARWDSEMRLSNFIQGSSAVVTGGRNDTVSSPLSSVTLFENSGLNIQVDNFELYGR